MQFFTHIWNKAISGGRGEHEPDQKIIITVGIIVIFGLIMLSSASSAYAYIKYGDAYFFFKHQLVGLGAGLIAFLITSKINYHIWKKYALWMLVGSVGLLLLVFIPGLAQDYGTARSWINIFGFSLQPSELVKISFLIYLAAWLESKGKRISDFHEGTAPFIMVLGIIAFLMIKQPDVGTLTIIALTSFSVYFIGGGNLKHILVVILLGILGLSFLISQITYQQERINCYLDPNSDPQDTCYQINQSLIAVGSGGILGRGLGASRQKFLYLPEVQGDSIFSIIGEETGLVFSSALVLIFIYLFYRGFNVAKYAPDNFGKNLAIGIVTWLVLQSIINIGGMINLIPMTGVPLPFISYGGSAMMAALAAVGILVNISKQTKNY